MSLDELQRVYNSAVIADPSRIYRSEWTGPEEIAKAVHEDGIVVFRSFLDDATLEALNVEFDDIVNEHRAGRGPFYTDDYENLFNVRALREELRADSMPVTTQLFASPTLGSVAQAYFDDEEFMLNQAIFFTHLEETKLEQTAPPFALHFDKQHLFKFYFYLHDTDESTGAMRVAPGSNKVNRKVRLQALEEGYRKNLPNIPPVKMPSYPVTGPAGTLMIFDTDMCHGAGSVAPDKVRRTVRGHSPSMRVYNQFAHP